MPTTSVIGYGGTLKIGGASVAQVEEITLPDEETTKVDITHLLSPNATKEKRAGLIDQGDLEAKVIFTAAGYATVRALRDARGIAVCIFQLADGTAANTGSSWTFNAFISKLAGEVPLDDKVMATIGLTISGLAVFAAAT